MKAQLVKLLSTTLALFFGSGLTCVYALTETDFTNTGVVISASTQFENNNNNNDSVVLVQPKGMEIRKEADVSAMSTPSQVGDIITYSITIDNVGLLGLTGVVVVDPLIPAANIALSSGDLNSDNILDADEVWVYTGTYALTQDDIDTFGGGDGDIDNTVTVSTNELGPLTDSVEVPITQAPEFAVSKSVDEATVAEPGTLTYEILVENTGNQSLTGISLDDTLHDGTTATLSGPTGDVGTASVLDVGETWAYQATYSVTQANIDAGNLVVNTVDVTTNETGADIQSDNAQTSIVKTPLMSVSKTVDIALINSPDTLNYTISVENTGNVTLNNVVYTDTLPDGSAAVLTGPVNDTGAANALDVGETWTFTGNYSAVQSDIDSQADLVNLVSFVSDETGDATFSSDAITTISNEPAMEVTKSVDIASLDAPGTLNYVISVSNTGNVSLNNVNPIDILPDGTTAVLVGPVNDIGLVDQLDVGETWEYTTTYGVSQAEIDLGVARTNTVDVTSDETGADGITDSAQTTINRTPSFTVTKHVDLASISEPGILEYEILINNTGNTSLSSISVSDTLPDGTAATVTGPLADSSTPGMIDVGESWTYLAQYSVSQAEVNAGAVLTNSVTVTTAEAGSQSDTADTSVAQTPGISIVKAALEEEYTSADNSVNYSFVVTNTGNVLLSNVVVDDPIVDAGSLVCDLIMPFSLQPADQVSCTAVRTVTIGDVANLQITNQASVSSEDPSGTAIDADSNTIVIPMLQLPPIATDNSFESQISAVPVTLAGAQDDIDLNGDHLPSTVNLVDGSAVDLDGDGDTDTLVVAGEGTWLVDDVTGEVTFTPEPGFSADPTPINYTLSDATGLVSNEATLTVGYPQTAPVAEDDFKLNPNVSSPNNPTTLNVLADNGSGFDSDPENDINVTSINLINPNAVDTDGDGDNDSLVVPGEGAWTLQNATGDITFVPEAGFLSDPTPILYTVSDINALVSNTATITVDYPQTAPIAVDDEKLNQPLGKPVTLAVVSNDTDPENDLVPSTVQLINPETGEPTTLLAVPGEGVWIVDVATGDITFSPERGFLNNPAVVQYTVFDSTGLESNMANVTVTFEEPASLEGIVWLDSDRNGLIDTDEERKAGWTLMVFNDAGEVVATVVTDADGHYLVEGLIPGTYRVDFFNEIGVFMDSQSTNGPILAGEVANLPLPVDPGGVVYDSITRLPVAGVTLNLINGDGNLLHADCLRSNQQSQITQDDGLYAFNVLPGAHETCPSEGFYNIEVANAPTEYFPNFSSILRQEGASGCGDATLGCAVSDLFDSAQNEDFCTIDSLPGTLACEVQPQPNAPTDAEDTRYFVEFFVQSGDRNVIFNHLPIDTRDTAAQLLLSKVPDKGDVSVGSLVEYTLSAENTRDIPAVDITIVDQPPANFSLVAESVRAIKVGADGEFDTADDDVATLSPQSLSPILFDGIDFEPSETIRFKYVMRVGVGVVAGTYANKASATGPGGVASNMVSATVEVVADPVLQQATLVGKVFHDRDTDGTQDSADATGVAVRSDHYGWNSLNLPPLPGRQSVNEDPAENAAVVNMPISADNRFMVVTREGTRISVDHQGTISEAHVGQKARGLNAQDLRVCTQLVSAVPTDQAGVTPENGGVTDVLQIVIQNYGVNEEGIPGVRLATVTGLLIETDAYGRYNIPDVDAGATGIGQNFVLKVDPTTLPQGARFTTENPYVLRIVNSTLNKINFGVKVPEDDPYLSHTSYLCDHPEENTTRYQSVEVNLGSVFFDTDKADVREDQRGIVIDIVNKLREYGGGEILIEAHTDSRGSDEYNRELAERRAQTIRNILQERLGPELIDLISVKVDAGTTPEEDQ